MFYDMTWLERIIFLKRKGGGGTPAHEATSYTGSFFTDMIAPLKKLLVSFVPKQDLHGYDKPWAGGNGKNLLNPILLKDQEAWNVIKIYADEGTILTASTSTPAGKGLFAYFRQPNGDQGTANGVVTGAQHKAVTQTVGSDGYVELVQRRSTGTDSFQNYNWQIEKGSSATSYEPYENICPISGHTECVTEVCWVNLWDEEWELGSYGTTDGEPATYTDRIRSKNRISVVPNTEYFFKTSNGLTAGNMYFYDINDVFISAKTSRGNNVTTTPDNCRYMRISMGLPYGTTYNNDVSINYPSTDTDYHAYQGTTYIASLSKNIWNKNVRNGDVMINGLVPGQRYTASAKMVNASTPTYCYIRRKLKTESEYTNVNEIIKNKTVKPVSFTVNGNYDYSVWCNAAYGNVTDVQIELGSVATEYEPYGTPVYGSTVDLINGEAVVDKGFATFNGSETWTKNTRALNAFYVARPQGCKQGTTMLSDKFVYVDNVQTLYTTYGACFCGSSMNFNVDPTTIGGDTIEDWKAWLANNPLQVVYELATPQTYQLTPQQINSLIGQNNIITEDGVEVSEVVYMTHLVGGSLLGGSTSSPNSEDESEEPVEEIEESGE